LDSSVGSTDGTPALDAAAIDAMAGRRSHVTFIASAPSSARARLVARTIATGSPTKRTSSIGRGGISTGCSPSIGGAMRNGLTSGARSVPVRTATTPGTVRRSRVDCPDASTGVRAAHEGRMQAFRGPDIGQILAKTEQQPEILAAQDGLADWHGRCPL
jgi:hypothetical protein